MITPNEDQVPDWKAYDCFMKFAEHLVRGRELDFVWGLWGQMLVWPIVGLIIAALAGAAAILAGGTSESGWGGAFFCVLLPVFAAFLLGPFLFGFSDMVSRGRDLLKQEWLEQQKKTKDL